MTNFYEELKLDKAMSSAELQDNLIRLESIWTDRASTRPEKATEMLALIAQAKKVFASETSKAAYDRELFAPPKIEEAADPEAARKAEFEKWRDPPRDDLSRGENDMAKTALERALPNADENDFSFLDMAAHICKLNGEYQAALSHINKAILVAPDLADLYITKAQVYESLYHEENNARNKDAALALRQARETMRMASDKAARQGDTAAQARADGALAFLLYFNEPRDVATAEKYAKRALENGDSFGNAKRVLDDLAASRDAAEKAAKLEQERRAELAKKNAAERERQAKLEQERQQKIAAADAAQKKANSLYVFGWIAVVLSFALVFVIKQPATAVLVALIALGSVALLNYADNFKNVFGSNVVIGASFVLGFTNSFITATAAYDMIGHNASGAGKTWIIFGILLAIYAAVIFIAKAIGKRASKRTNYK